MKQILIICTLLLLGIAGHAQQIDAIIKNKPTTLVNDYANVIPDDQQQQLERTLVAYDDSTSNQIAIVTVKTLDGRPIEETALAIYRAWGIGNKKTNNGVLILAAIDDRQIRIEVGYGLEGAIPDITANQIIRNDIGPNFRSGDYYEGFNQAAANIIKAAAGEYKAPANYHKKREGRGTGWGILAFIIVIVILSIIRGGGGGGGMMSRRGFHRTGPVVFWPGGGGGWSGGGGGGWSGGGGGFGGFGGGSSGGGGASGSW